VTATVGVFAAAGVGVTTGVCPRRGVAAGESASQPPARVRVGGRVDGPDQDDGLVGRGEVEKEVPQVQTLPRDPAATLPPRAQRERSLAQGRRCQCWPPASQRMAKWRAAN
jgi:hypothetical protein